MPQFMTKDGQVVEFESQRDPAVPLVRVLLSWLVARRLPILLAVGNSLLIGSSTVGVLVTLVLTCVLVWVGYRSARVAVGEAAYWSTKMGQVDRYRTQNRRSYVDH